jgi:hypothetical protein
VAASGFHSLILEAAEAGTAIHLCNPSLLWTRFAMHADGKPVGIAEADDIVVE